MSDILKHRCLLSNNIIKVLIFVEQVQLVYLSTVPEADMYESQKQ